MSEESTLDFIELISAQRKRKDLAEHRREILRSLGEHLRLEPKDLAVIWLLDRYPNEEKFGRRCTAWHMTSMVQSVNLEPLDFLDKDELVLPPGVQLPDFADETHKDAHATLEETLRKSTVARCLEQEALDRAPSLFIPIRGPKLALNFAINEELSEPGNFEIIGFVQLVTRTHLSEVSVTRTERLLNLWGQAIQNERKMRAMDGVERFVQKLRGKLTLDDFIPTVCEVMQQIVNCSRVLAYKREFNDGEANARCIYDTELRGRPEDHAHQRGQIVYEQFDRVWRSPGTHVSRVIDVSDTNELSDHFGSAQLDKQDIAAGYQHKHAGMMVISVLVPLHDRKRNESKATFLLKVISSFGSTNPGGSFSETEQYILAAAAQYVAARLPWLLFKMRLEALRLRSRPNPSGSSVASPSSENYLPRMFGKTCIDQVDFISDIDFIEEETLGTTLIPAHLPKKMENAALDKSRIMKNDGSKIEYAEGDARSYFYWRIGNNNGSMAWAMIEVESCRVTEQDFDLIEWIFSEISLLWHVTRDLGEEARKGLEKAHAINSTLGAAVNNISRAKSRYDTLKNQNIEDAHDGMFNRANMRRYLSDAELFGHKAKIYFTAERLTKGNLEESDLKRKPLDLHRMVTDSCRVFRQLAEDRGIEIMQEPGYLGPHTPIHVDRDLMSVVIVNLVENAVKHSFRDQQVTIHYGYRWPGFYLRTENVGIHMPDEIIDYVKTAGGRQMPPAGYEGKPGSGLGLAVVQRVLWAHDSASDLTVSSTPSSIHVEQATISVGFTIRNSVIVKS